MLLYTRLSAEQARRLEQTGALPPEELYFADRPLTEGAAADAVWISIEVPDAEAWVFESVTPPDLGYHEFVLDGSDAQRYPVSLVDRVEESP